MVDVEANRAAQKWSPRVQIGRILWSLSSPFFRYSPRSFWAWRRWMLRLFGAQVAAEVHVYPTVQIIMPWNLVLAEGAAVGDFALLYALGPITLGPRSTISQRAHLCAGTHDINQPDRPLVKQPILVAHDVWVAADAFIGPNVTIGHGAVIGARAVVTKDVEPRNVVAGNPARLLRILET